MVISTTLIANPTKARSIDMKTYAQWNGSGLDLSKFLQVGDEVDEMMVEYFRDVLPPATHRSTLIQIGEPYSSVDDRETFSTIRQENGRWYYAGHCHRGDSIEPRPVNERLFIGVFPAALSYGIASARRTTTTNALPSCPTPHWSWRLRRTVPRNLPRRSNSTQQLSRQNADSSFKSPHAAKPLSWVLR
jgi:hypothetical protein